MRALMFALVFVAGCGAEENDDAEIATSTPCERLREHLVDLRLAGVKSLDKEAHRKIHIDAMGNDFLAACGKMRDATITCALEAADSASATACNAGASQ